MFAGRFGRVPWIAVVATSAALGVGLAGCSLGSRLERPVVIAHRAGGAVAPENTVVAIERALHDGADMIWLSVQVSADGVPVLYRPRDLSALTDGVGAVSSFTAEQLADVNAGWWFEGRGGAYPYRVDPVGIPTFAEALSRIPGSVRVVVDVKTAAADPLVPALFDVVEELGAWERVVFYSTQAGVSARLVEDFRATVFEARAVTRERLLRLRLGGRCVPPAPGAWVGFEVFRELEVSEEFVLGRGRTNLTVQMWDREAMDCTRRAAGARVVFFGVNSDRERVAARVLGADGVLVDSVPWMLGGSGFGE